MKGKTKETKTWREWDAERIGGVAIISPTEFLTGDPLDNYYVWTRDEFLEKRLKCGTTAISPLRKVVTE